MGWGAGERRAPQGQWYQRERMGPERSLQFDPRFFFALSLSSHLFPSLFPPLPFHPCTALLPFPLVCSSSCVSRNQMATRTGEDRRLPGAYARRQSLQRHLVPRPGAQKPEQCLAAFCCRRKCRGRPAEGEGHTAHAQLDLYLAALHYTFIWLHSTIQFKMRTSLVIFEIMRPFCGGPGTEGAHAG